MLDRIERRAAAADRKLSALGRTLDRVGGSNTDRKIDTTAHMLDKVGDKALGSAAKVKALEHELKELKRQSAEARLAQAGLGNQMSTTGRQAHGLKQKLGETGAALAGLGKIIGLGRIPLMGVGIGVAVQAVSSLSAGVVGLLPHLADMTGMLGALPATYAGVGIALGTVKFAFSGLTKAMAGNKKALAALTPEGKKFIGVLKGYKPVVASLRAEAQKGLFPGLTAALKQMQQAIPLADRLLRRGGRTVGTQATQWANFLTEPGRLKDLNTIGDQGLAVFSRISKGVRNLVAALMDMAVAAKPFTDWLSKSILHWTEWVKQTSRARRESGAWATFFERTKTSLTNFVHILENLGHVFVNLMGAARGLSDNLYKSMERTTKHWATWTGSLKGQNYLRQWFNDAATSLHAMFRLVGALGKAIATFDRTGLTDTLNTLTKTVGPLKTLFETLSRAGPAVATTLNLLVSILSEMGPGVGVFTQFLTALNNILSVVNKLIDVIPGLGTVFAAALTFAAAWRMRSAIMGIAQAWGIVAKTAGTAAVAEQAAMGGGVAAAAARVQGIVEGGAARVPFGKGFTAARGVEGTSLLAAGRSAFTGAGGFRGLAGGAAEFMGPMAAFGGALGALQGTSGQGIGGLALNAVSGATFGLVPGADQMRGQGATAGGLKGALGGAGAGAAIGTMFGGPGIGTAIGAGVGLLVGGVAGIFGGSRANPQQFLDRVKTLQEGWAKQSQTIPHLEKQTQQLRKVRADVVSAVGLTDTERKSLLTSINQEITARRQATSALIHERNNRQIAQGAHHGGRIAQAFSYTAQHGGATAAFDYASRKISGDFNSGDRRRMNIAQLQPTLSAAYSLARKDPSYRGRYQALRREAESLYTQGTGGRIAVINGQIHNVAQNRYGAIAHSLNDPLARQKALYNKGLTVPQRVMVAQLVVMGADYATARTAVLSSETRPGAITRMVSSFHRTQDFNPRSPRAQGNRAGFGWNNAMAIAHSYASGMFGLPVLPGPHNARGALSPYQGFHFPVGATSNKTPTQDLQKVLGGYRDIGKTVARVMPLAAKTTDTNFQAIHDSQTKNIDTAHKDVTHKLSDLDTQFATRTKSMLASTKTNFSGIYTEMTNWLTKINGGGGGGAGGGGGGARHNATGGRVLATGGRLQGSGLRDTIPVGNNTMAAPGELVVNRHTEGRVNRLLSLFGTTLGSEVGSEQRPHYLARGGRVGGGDLFDGHPSNVNAAVTSIIRTMKQHFPLSVTSTTDHSRLTTSGNVSDHVSGAAVDLAGSPDVMIRAANWVKSSGMYRRIKQGIHNPNLAINAGQIETPPGIFAGHVWAEHANHIHLAALGAALSGFMAHMPHMRHRTVGDIGLIHAMGQGATNNATSAAQARIARRFNAMMGGGGNVASSTYRGPLNHRFSPHSGITLGPDQVAALARSVGLPGAMFEKIAHGESNYEPGAISNDGGYGLWQMTPRVWGPAARAYMDKLGGVNAMLNPVKNAEMAKYLWDHASSHTPNTRGFPWFGTKYLDRGGRVDWGGWNARGGEFSVSRPTLLGVGESGTEHVKITPAGARSNVAGGLHVHIGTIENHREGDVVRIIHDEFKKLEAELDMAGSG